MKEKEHDADTFLSQVGDNVRNFRARRGMTRKMLADDSGVSERYLADLEQGKGNISIYLLRQVATALRTDVTDLVRTATSKSPELILLTELISNLDTAGQSEILQLLYDRHSTSTRNRRRFALIGLRGAGKSTLGELLAGEYGIPFVQLKAVVEQLGGMTVSEILSLSGQTGYRRLEHRALAKVLHEYPACCIETGGSIVSEPRALNVLLSTCFVIWIKTSPEEHMQRVIDQGDLRPIEDNQDAMDDLRRILNERNPYYAKAHATLDTSGKSVSESFADLLNLLPHASRRETGGNRQARVGAATRGLP